MYWGMIKSLIDLLFVRCERQRMNSTDLHDVTKKIGYRSIIMGLLLLLFFTGIILGFYSLMYSSLKDNIRLAGEETALESAEKLDQYLTISSSVVKLEKQYLDQMLDNGYSDYAFQKYLVEETLRIQDSVDPSYTGLYGWIRGKYHDGANWVPDEGYVPTERPWYTEAVENPEELVIVDPYVDAQTDTIVTTLAMTLNDHVSVLALDITFDMIKTITKEQQLGDEGSFQVVIDDRGIAVAHTIQEEIGHNYMEETGTFGAAIADKLKKTHERSVDIVYDGQHYMVYTLPLSNGWHSISVINTTESYIRLNRIFIIVLVVLLVTITIVTKTFTNLTIKSIREKQLIDLSEKAVAASEAKSAFLSNMSHEIRTPINAIMGLNEMILRESTDPDTLGYASGINTAGHTLLGIINDILDFSKIEAGKMEIIPVDYSLSSVLNDLSTMAHTRADAKGLQVIVKVDAKLPEHLRGDEIRVKQVITNILTNAVKYTEKGSVTFTMGFERIPEAPEEILLKVSVADTGIGIKPEDLEKLCKKFVRIEESRNRNIEGTGLGLSITQSLLDMMGSKLEVESTYGEGSVFSFALRQQVTDWTEIGDYESSYRKGLQEKPKYKEKFIAPEAEVLVVDDTHMNLKVFQSLLKKTQVKIDTCDSGNKAIAAACSKVYDIIFLDHMMPEKDGIETLKELQEKPENLNKNTPVICLTANAISGSREKYLRAGFDDYLSKPIDSAKLEDMLQHYLPKKKVLDPGTEPAPKPQHPDLIPASVYKIKELDVDAAVKRCGSPELYLEILGLFEDNLRECLNEAELCREKDDLAELSVKIHTIKSEVRTVGAFGIGDHAQQVENAAKEGDHEFLEEHLGQLFYECRDLEDKLSSFKPKAAEDDEALGSLDEKQMREIYEKISGLAEDFYYDEVEEILEKLHHYHIPEEHLDRINRIRHHLSHFEYEQIEELLKEAQEQPKA